MSSLFDMRPPALDLSGYIELMQHIQWFPSFGNDKYEDPVAAEIQKIFKDEAGTVISDLTFGEVEELFERLSVPMQEAAYVQKSKSASWMMPGKGQFMNDEVVSGILFLTADIVVTAGTLAGSYFLLPAA